MPGGPFSESPRPELRHCLRSVPTYAGMPFLLFSRCSAAFRLHLAVLFLNSQVGLYLINYFAYRRRVRPPLKIVVLKTSAKLYPRIDGYKWFRAEPLQNLMGNRIDNNLCHFSEALNFLQFFPKHGI